MPRIVLTTGSLLLGYWALSIIRTVQPTPSVALRDGGLLVIVSLVIFAFAAPRPFLLRSNQSHPSPDRRRRQKRWSLARRILLGICMALALASGLLLFQGLPSGLTWMTTDHIILVWFGSLLVSALVAAWPQRRPTFGPVWSVESAHRLLESSRYSYVQGATPATISTRTTVLFLIVWILLAFYLRVSSGLGLPQGCSQAACDSALQALEILRSNDWSDLVTGSAPLFTALVAAVFGLWQPGMDTLRAIGLAIGTVTIPAFYLAVRYVARPVTAVAGTLIVALLPAFVELSRYPGPETLLLLLLAIFLWLRLSAPLIPDGRRWILAGFAGGISLFSSPAFLVLPLFIWMVVIAPWRGWQPRLLYWSALFVASLPAFARLNLPLGFQQQVDETLTSLVSPWQVESSMAGALIALLGLYGLVYMARYPRWTPSPVVWSGIVLTVAAMVFTVEVPGLAGTAPILLLLSISAVVAADQVIGVFAQSWQPIIRPALTASGASILVLLLLGTPSLQTLQAMGDDPAFVAKYGVSEEAIGRYLGNLYQSSLESNARQQPVLLVPTEILHAPATQVSAGAALFASAAPRGEPGLAGTQDALLAPAQYEYEQIQPLDPVQHLPFVNPAFTEAVADGGLRYLVPAGPSGQPTTLLSHLQNLYPGLSADTIQEENTGRAAAYVLTVPVTVIRSTHGVALTYFEGTDFESTEPARLDEAVHTERSGALNFDWQPQPPARPPFSMTAQGSVFIPETGSYSFSVDMNEEASVQVSLGSPPIEQILIDSESGTVETEVSLQHGFYPLRLHYASGETEPFLSLSWRRPDGNAEPIPQQALRTHLLDNGLVAAYYETSSFHEDGVGQQASSISTRREPLPMLAPVASPSGSVVWQAKLATPVAGTYSFTTRAAGSVRITVDDSVLIDETTRSNPVSPFRTTAVQLTEGWHDLHIQYSPDGNRPQFWLAWQPPGYSTGQIPVSHFLPYDPAVDVSDIPLPSLPLEIGMTTEGSMPPTGALGTPMTAPGEFHLVTEQLPESLPELSLQEVWRVGQCGSDDDSFDQPRSVLFMPDREELLLADTNNRRIVILSMDDGSRLRLVESDQFEEPFDLGRSLLDDIYILDAVSGPIFRYDVDSDSLAPFPVETSFYRPRGLSVGFNGDLLVADTGGARVALVSSGGAVLDQFGGPDTPLGSGQPIDTLRLPNGALYTITAEDGALWRLDTRQGRAAVLPSNTAFGPHLAALPNSTFFVTDPERRLLLFFGGDGVASHQFSNGNFTRPVGIDVMIAEGRVLVAVTDADNCTVSLWELPLDAVPSQ